MSSARTVGRSARSLVGFIARRLIQAVPTVIGITFVGFLILHLVPGDPGRIRLGPRAPQKAVDELNRELGLDQPFLEQYGNFVSGALQLDFGDSLSTGEPVASVLASSATASVGLITYGLLIALLLAIPIAIFVAVRPDRPADHAVRVVGMVLFAMPPFWLGLLLILALAYTVGVFPVGGYEDGLRGALRTLTLPALTLALVAAPLFVRTLRASLLTTLSAGFIEAARARGLSERRIMFRYALRNSSVSLVTLVGLVAGFLISQSVVIESVFGIPGLGSLLIQAVVQRDFALIQGLLLVMGVAVVVINLVTDIVYAVVDPRVRM